MTIDIISSVLDAEPFLPDFLRSLERQTHTDWRLWVRDDGSRDRSVEIVRAAAAKDSRIRLLHVGGPRLGVAGGFGWLLERVPEDAAYVMCGDADDVWLPHKIARTLEAMQAAERSDAGSTPVLVHTDLTVVDATLEVRHSSFWSFSGFDPEPATLRRLVVRNVVTAPTVMMNRPLRLLVGRTPDRALFQDWWYALVAAAFGRVVAVRESTVLYRQHGANAVGARDARLTLRGLPAAAARRLANGGPFRQALARTAAQAAAFGERYGDRLSAADRQFLNEYSQLPQRSAVARKLALMRLRALPEHTMAQRLGILWRG